MDILVRFAQALLDGSVRVVDLSHPLRASTPVIGLPPPLAQSSPFSMTELSRYDGRGPAWYWNDLHMGEHTGTHFDAPAHWVTGRDKPDGTLDTLDPQRLVAPACVVDCTEEAASDEGFLLQPAHVEAWEARHGRIPRGSWVRGRCLSQRRSTSRAAPAARSGCWRSCRGAGHEHHTTGLRR